MKVRTLKEVRQKQGQQIVKQPAGTIIEHPDAWRLVKLGVAEEVVDVEPAAAPVDVAGALPAPAVDAETDSTPVVAAEAAVELDPTDEPEEL